MRKISVLALAMLFITILARAAISAILVEQPQLPSEALTYPVYLEGDKIGKGTAFFMIHNSYGYLITARHLLYSYSDRDSTWVFGNKSIAIASYPADPGTSPANLLVLRPSDSDISKYCKFHNSKDIAAIQLGRIDTVFINYYSFVDKKTPKSSIYLIHSSWVKTYDKVQIGDEAFILGYPTSIGVKNLPQIDYTKPLLRKCVVAGKNKKLRTMIFDCPVYPGNSGGPVFEYALYQSGGSPNKIFLIGVVSQLIPFTQEWVNKWHGDSYTEVSNSGYSVITPVDDVLYLLEEF